MINLTTSEHATQLELLKTVHGARGSGTIRYAAAMYFFQRGELTSKALEIYRTLAKDDDSDPRLALTAAKCEKEVAYLTGRKS